MILFSGREIALPKFRENDRLISRCLAQAASARTICLQRIRADFLIGLMLLETDSAFSPWMTACIAQPALARLWTGLLLLNDVHDVHDVHASAHLIELVSGSHPPAWRSRWRRRALFLCRSRRSGSAPWGRRPLRSHRAFRGSARDRSGRATRHIRCFSGSDSLDRVMSRCRPLFAHSAGTVRHAMQGPLSSQLSTR